ncbi:MAG: hypothetical protein P4L68_01095 [Methylovirgula sp.]|nr:hypothetical protein [Methylovirgula sp.]
MRPQPIVLHLGGQDFHVRPLTLAQVQRIEPLLATQSQRAGTSIAVASEIVAISLERDHPQAAATLGEMEATATEIAAAMRAVLRLAGFIAADGAETASGEGQAGADSISA